MQQNHAARLENATRSFETRTRASTRLQIIRSIGLYGSSRYLISSSDSLRKTPSRRYVYAAGSAAVGSRRRFAVSLTDDVLDIFQLGGAHNRGCDNCGESSDEQTASAYNGTHTTLRELPGDGNLGHAHIALLRYFLDAEVKTYMSLPCNKYCWECTHRFTIVSTCGFASKNFADRLALIVHLGQSDLHPN